MADDGLTRVATTAAEADWAAAIPPTVVSRAAPAMAAANRFTERVMAFLDPKAKSRIFTIHPACDSASGLSSLKGRAAVPLSAPGRSGPGRRQVPRRPRSHRCRRTPSTAHGAAAGRPDDAVRHCPNRARPVSWMLSADNIHLRGRGPGRWMREQARCMRVGGSVQPWRGHCAPGGVAKTARSRPFHHRAGHQPDDMSEDARFTPCRGY